MKFKEMTLKDIELVAELYVKTFNSEPWNDSWTIETATKRLTQMMDAQAAYGIMAYEDEMICGMILGSEEQYYNGPMFNIKEFCVRNDIRNSGFGTKIFKEFEKRLKEKGICSLTLNTVAGHKTEGFYHKMGMSTFSDMIVMGKEI